MKIEKIKSNNNNKGLDEIVQEKHEAHLKLLEPYNSFEDYFYNVLQRQNQNIKEGTIRYITNDIAN